MGQQPSDRPRDVVVVTGAGGMGAAIARRLGSGRTLFLVDASRGQLDRTVAALRAEGHAAHGVLTDISDCTAVEMLAQTAAGEGRAVAVAHMAGSPPRSRRRARSWRSTCWARSM
jgi:NAD(P)-dependent dehydrogenase (short-subunit alcohol dehydrogenase family)